MVSILFALVEKRSSHGSDVNMAHVIGQLEQDEAMARRLQVGLIMSGSSQTTDCVLNMPLVPVVSQVVFV